ncbi:hypothetical protein QTP88_010207 [Uroleucon formosanum]
MFSVQVWVLFPMMVILNQAVIIDPKRPPSKDIDCGYSKYITYPDAKRNISKADDSRYSLNIINPKDKKNKNEDGGRKIHINIIRILPPSSEKKNFSKLKEANKSTHNQTGILQKHTHKHKHKKHKKPKGHKKLQGHKQPGHKHPQKHKQPQGYKRPQMQSTNGGDVAEMEKEKTNNNNTAAAFLLPSVGNIFPI